jgi:phospholipase/carboxylesterase
MMHARKLVESGKPLGEAKKALIMLHGRGASAEDILSLSSYLSVDDFYLVAPQATNHTWYPYSFMAPVQQNEPWLSSALQLLEGIVGDIKAGGIFPENIFILGFSQGACLTLEFSTRHAQRWGGVIAFTGGLIGEKIFAEHYNGTFVQTNVLMSNSTNDPHVPLSRSEASKKLMEEMGAHVTLKVYPNRPHTILQEELDLANDLLTNAG